MKRLVPILLVVLLLVGCGTATEPEFTPTSGVQMDLSKLEQFTPVEEIFTRLSEERVEDLVPGDYGLLRPYIGSRVAFDVTIYGNNVIYNGNMGLIDENGAIVVDPVYTDVKLMTDWENENAPKFWKLSKEAPKDNYVDQIYGFCTLDGTVAEPCIYESVQYSNGYIVAVNRNKDGLLRIFDGEGNLLLDSETWKEQYPIYSEMGYSSVEVSENLLFLHVTDDTADYGMDGWLCDWEGNILSKDYDFVTLSGEAPYACGLWGGGACGYVDAYGNLLTYGYESVSPYYFGQALVRRNGQHQVIDLDGNVLWEPDADYLYTCVSRNAVYYQVPFDDGTQSSAYHFYDSNFELMYPEADFVNHMNDDWFLVCEDGVCRMDNGERSVVLDGAVPDKNVYYSADETGDGLLLITTYANDRQIYWLFNEDMELLKTDTVENEYVNIVLDRLGDSSVVVGYDWKTYPNQYRPLDYSGAPNLIGVNVVAVYDGWYLVEDEFSAGYMDKDGNWLFRVSLMEDMVD